MKTPSGGASTTSFRPGLTSPSRLPDTVRTTGCCAWETTSWSDCLASRARPPTWPRSSAGYRCWHRIPRSSPRTRGARPARRWLPVPLVGLSLGRRSRAGRRPRRRSRPGGRDLAGFVRALHGIDLMGARRREPLTLLVPRGSLRHLTGWTAENLAACRGLVGLDLDLDRLGSAWQAWAGAGGTQRPAYLDAYRPQTLQPGRPGRHAGRRAGSSAASRSAIRPVSTPRRGTCRPRPAMPTPTSWSSTGAPDCGLVRVGALAISLSGVPYYWTTWPSLRPGSALRRLRLILDDVD